METPSRKVERLANKKRKIEALLALALSNESNIPLKRKKLDDASSSDDSSEDTNKNIPNPDVSGRTSMTDAEIREGIEKSKKEIKDRQKKAMARPKVFLTLDNLSCGSKHSFSNETDQDRRPLYLMDIQNLLLFALQGQRASYKPLWCKLLRVGKVSNTCLVVLENVSAKDYKDSNCFTNLRSLMPEVSAEFVSPIKRNSSLIDELVNVPLIGRQIHLLPFVKKPSAPSKKGKVVVKMTTSYEVSIRMDLLLTTPQLIQEGYPIPDIGRRYIGYVYTKRRYSPVTSSSPIFSIDCEMCQTKEGSELTRVSVINEKMECLYDSFVKPRNPIVDYVTRFSGITKQLLDPVTTRIEDVQRDISKLIPCDAILAGQSLNFDLKALKMFHPYVIDTSTIFNISGDKNRKTGLKKLTEIFLDRKIQADLVKGHSPVEDASATMELVNLKLKNGLSFGDLTMSDEPLFLQLEEARAREAKLREAKPLSDLEKNCAETSETTADSKVEPGKLENGEEPLNKDDELTADDKQNILATFLNNKSKFNNNLFQIVAEAGKTMSIIDRESLFRQQPNKCITANLHTCTRKISETTEKALNEISGKDFTWIRYVGPRSNSDSREKKLKKLDDQIGQIIPRMRENTIFMVLMAGNLQSDGMVLVHIK